MHNDPEEMQKLINSPEHQELVKEFNKRVFDWLDETGGILIPLRRDSGNKLDKRKPAK